GLGGTRVDGRALPRGISWLLTRGQRGRPRGGVDRGSLVAGLAERALGWQSPAYDRRGLAIDWSRQRRNRTTRQRLGRRHSQRRLVGFWLGSDRALGRQIVELRAQPTRRGRVLKVRPARPLPHRRTGCER